MGRGANPPPQFGQTFPRTSSTHVAQNVHSKLQMRASSELGGSVLLQCSQVGRKASAWRTSKSSSVMPYLRRISSFDVGIKSQPVFRVWLSKAQKAFITCGARLSIFFSLARF